MSQFQDRFLSRIQADLNGHIDKAALSGVFPCTPIQEGMLSQFITSNGHLYFNHTLFRLAPGVDEARLRAAWRAVSGALDILRSGFVAVDGEDDCVHSFAMVTYHAAHQPTALSPRWIGANSVTPDGGDVHGLVEKHKALAAADALQRLYLPPWQLTFIRAASTCYLLFSGLHALYDATSLRHIFDDVAAHYGNSTGQQRARPHFGPALQDIVRHTVHQPTIEADRAFWLKQLQGSAICRVPNLCPVRTVDTSFHAKELHSTRTLASIEAACQRLGISLHAAGQAAWARLLAAYTGETIVTLGVVFSGRTGLDSASPLPPPSPPSPSPSLPAGGVVFPCLVTLPSVCVMGNGKTNLQLALDIQLGNAKALKHQHAPLKSIQRWLGHPEESFFDSIFVYQKTPPPEDDGGDDAAPPPPWEIVGEDASADYTLSLEIQPSCRGHRSGRLWIRATARNSHIPPEQTDLLIRQFEAALVDILDRPHRLSADLSHLPSELLSITPAAVDDISGDVRLLHGFVEKHRALCPDKVALEFVTAMDDNDAGDDGAEEAVTKQTWTYSQLDAEGNRVANFLRADSASGAGVGVRTGDIVAISFEKCPQASFAILGVLKAGCAYVAIDPSAPTERKAFIVQDSHAVAVLTMDKFVAEYQRAVRDDGNSSSSRVVSVESDSGIRSASPTTPVVDDRGTEDLTPQNLAYCLYTSGTTGTPKGCELTHENAVQAMYAFQRLFSPHWDADSRFLQFASFHFDVSVLELFWSWSVGICVTSAPRDLVFRDLARTIRKLAITHLDLTPSLAALLRPQDVPSLCRGVFITGGEALKQEILDTWGHTGVVYNG